MDETLTFEEIVLDLHNRLLALEGKRLHQSDIPPGTVKQRHIEASIIFSGTAANRPTNGSTQIQAYFATDTNVLSIWNGSAWKSTTLS